MISTLKSSPQLHAIRLALALLLALLGFAAAAVPAKPDLDLILQQAMEGTEVPAMAILLLRDNKVVQQAVRGVRRNDQPQPAALDDVWLIGSTGKVMTVALICRLVDRGLLSWQTPLAQMLPELAERMRPEYRKLTLVELLSHRSGLPENPLDLKFVDTFFDDQKPLPQQRQEFVAHALMDPPALPPGTGYGYSNSGFLIAAVIAEQASGTSFEELLRHELFAPLGMDSAGFGPVPAGQPSGHRAGKPLDRARNTDEGVPLMYSPAGYIHLSLVDWAKFCLDQLAGSQGSGKLLSRESYQLMQRAQPDSPAGLDWGVQDSIAGRRGPVLIHGGSDGNWMAWVVLFPASNSGVLVTANAGEDMGGESATHAAMAALFPSLAPPK